MCRMLDAPLDFVKVVRGQILPGPVHEAPGRGDKEVRLESQLTHCTLGDFVQMDDVITHVAHAEQSAVAGPSRSVRHCEHRPFDHADLKERYPNRTPDRPSTTPTYGVGRNPGLGEIRAEKPARR